MLISATDLISKSVKLYRDNVSLLLKYVGAMLIPGVLIMLSGLGLGMFMEMARSFFLGLAIYTIVVILLSLVAFWISLALIKTLAAKYQGQTEEPIDKELKNSLSLVLPAIIVSILVGLAVIGGSILLIIPGIIFAIWFAFAVYALVLDNKHGTEALNYSKSLVKGRWWGVLWRLFVPGLVFGILLGIVQWILGIFFGRSLNSTEVNASIVIYSILSMVINMLAAPLTTAAPTILYLELKKIPAGSHLPEEAEQTEPPKDE